MITPIEEAAITMHFDTGEGPNPFDPRRDSAATLTALRARLDEYRTVAGQAGHPVTREFLDDHLSLVVDDLISDRREAMEASEFHCEITRSSIAVEHCRSSLRMIAAVDPVDEDFMLSVEAKSYTVDPICAHTKAQRPAPRNMSLDWRRYRAIGIGEKMYRRADAELGGRRWGCGNIVSPAARPLREKLHYREPYKWKLNDCGLCAMHQIDWSAARPQDFPDHRQQATR
ncbi:hypothetical protein D2E41_26545 [Mycobacteroides abscessus]|nr:hypothetical protein D2E41_26545 [Mycobacteroides abscessus]